MFRLAASFASVIFLATILPLLARAQDATQTAPAPNSTPPDKPSDVPQPPPPPDKVHTENGPTNVDPLNMQGPFAAMLTPNVGHTLARFDYRATWFPDSSVSGQPGRLGYVDESLSVSVPVWQDLIDEITASISVRDESFHTGGLILPDSHIPFPDELWNIRIGAGYRHVFENGWIAGGNVNFGSASDKPFHSLDEMFVGVNAFLRIPQGEHNAWLFTLNYSPTGELPFPIPGIAFIWCPSPAFQAHIGLPFALMYRPTEDLSFEFSYMLLRTIHARANYRLGPTMRAYIGFDWSNESYFLAERTDNNDRFYYLDMRLTTGMQFLLPRHILLDVSGGYVFERSYFQAHSSNQSNFDRLDVNPGPLIGLRAGIRF
jgi:hypothetical protein